MNAEQTEKPELNVNQSMAVDFIVCMIGVPALASACAGVALLTNLAAHAAYNIPPDTASINVKMSFVLASQVVGTTLGLLSVVKFGPPLFERTVERAAKELVRALSRPKI